MSHIFINVVITGKEYADDGAEVSVESKLAAYSENLDIEPYDEPCDECEYTKDGEVCKECQGTGIAKSTYNPNSKWDWWVIGGRWDGVMCALDRIDDKGGGFNFGDKFHTEERNVCSIEDFKKDRENRIGFALVTPDGQWHEKGTMGWFGISHDDMAIQDWDNYVKKLLASMPLDYKVVGVDAHI